LAQANEKKTETKTPAASFENIMNEQAQRSKRQAEEEKRVEQMRTKN